MSESVRVAWTNNRRGRGRPRTPTRRTVSWRPLVMSSMRTAVGRHGCPTRSHDCRRRLPAVPLHAAVGALDDGLTGQVGDGGRVLAHVGVEEGPDDRAEPRLHVVADGLVVDGREAGSGVALEHGVLRSLVLDPEQVLVAAGHVLERVT